MSAPERRTRADLLAAAAIVVVIALVAVVVWQRSDARGTVSVTAQTPATQPATALAVPSTLRELWRANSPASTAPIVANGAVVTADDGTVTGLDPTSGVQLWHYQRNVPLCGAIGAWGTVVAVYRDQRGCSQVTQLDGADGHRTGARSSYADNSVQLSEDGTYVLSRGPNRLEMWRSDLVRTVEYGYVDAPVNPKSQPRTGCTLLSAASSGTRLGVLERCPGDVAARLTVLNPVPKDATKPEEYGSNVVLDLLAGGEGAQVLAASGDRIALYVPGDNANLRPYLGIFDSTAQEVARYPLTERLPANAVAVKVPGAYLLWTGAAVVALRGGDLAPLWSALGAIGPGTAMAGTIVVPVPDGVQVLDPATGRQITRVPVQRPDQITDPILSAVVGNTIVEQRGDQLVALG